MAKIHKGRFTASVDGAFVVFLIGMRVNKPWKVRSWLPVAKAMPGMQRELLAQPELGCVSMSNWMGARGSLSVQYWRDFESLDAYARDPNQGHLPAWKAFNKAIRDNGDVGIWHETYSVPQGSFETVYGNMPTFGLAAAFDHVNASSIGNSAAKRISATDNDQTAVDPY